MVFGTLKLTRNTLTTHNDVYVLDSISVVSIRRPFFSTGMLLAGLLTLFGIGTFDLLYVGELILLASLAVASLTFGLTIGQLHLVSRDLRNSPIAEAVYGTYGHLTRERLKIAEAVQQARKGGVA